MKDFIKGFIGKLVGTVIGRIAVVFVLAGGAAVAGMFGYADISKMLADLGLEAQTVEAAPAQ